MNEPKPSARKIRVAVLMGGTSSERPISLTTGQMILKALDPDRYAVTGIDTAELFALPGDSALQRPAITAAVFDESDREEEQEMQALIGVSGQEVLPASVERPDVVFIALHGKGGEDGTLQGMLETMGLPYTGSGVLASALAMNKSMTKRLFRSEGIPVIAEVRVHRGQVPAPDTLIASVEAALGFPVFVKPNEEGSTFGASLVKSPDQLVAAVNTALEYDKVVLIERYVRGVEVTAGVLGNAGDTLEALPLVEIVPKAEYYDFESKYSDGGSEHMIPARLTAAQTQQVQETALRCHTLLGCRGVSRTDFIVTEDQMFVLEVNTIPGMTPTSLLPQAANHSGISFSALLDRLIADALSGQG